MRVSDLGLEASAALPRYPLPAADPLQGFGNGVFAPGVFRRMRWFVGLSLLAHGVFLSLPGLRQSAAPEPPPLVVQLVPPKPLPEPPKVEPPPPPPKVEKAPPPPKAVKAPPKPIAPPPPKAAPTPPPVAEPPPAPVLALPAAPPEAPKPAFQVPPQPPEPAVPPPPAPKPPPPVVAPVFVPPGYADNPKPRYPSMARRLGLEGEVKLTVRVSAGGAPVQVDLLSSSGHGVLDRAALESVKGWRFTPARRGDKAVEETIIVPIRFRMADPS